MWKIKKPSSCSWWLLLHNSWMTFCLKPTAMPEIWFCPTAITFLPLFVRRSNYSFPAISSKYSSFDTSEQDPAFQYITFHIDAHRENVRPSFWKSPKKPNSALCFFFLVTIMHLLSTIWIKSKDSAAEFKDPEWLDHLIAVILICRIMLVILSYHASIIFLRGLHELFYLSSLSVATSAIS